MTTHHGCNAPDLAAAPPSCPSGHPLQPGAPFCSACGAPVVIVPPPPGVFPAPTRSRRGRWIAGAAIAAVLIAGGVDAALLLGSGDGGPDTTTVTGTFVLHDRDTAAAQCVGRGGYSDIGPGASVILTNEDGRILGSAALGAGRADVAAGTCRYRFAMPGVPEDQQQYAVQVTHRGKVVNSRAEMQRDGWAFELTLGG